MMRRRVADGLKKKGAKMSKHKSLLKKIIIMLVIALSGLGIWKFYTYPGSTEFFHSLKEVLSQTNIPLFCVAVILYLLSIPLAVLSWNALLKAFRSGVPVIQLIPILMAGVFTNNITPMSRAGGEVVRVYGLRDRFKLPYTVAFLSVALSKLTEIIPLGLLGLMGLSVLLQSKVISWHQIRFVGIIGGVVVGAAVLVVCKRHYLGGLWTRILNHFLRKEQKHSGSQITMAEIKWAIRQKRAFGESLLFSLALWVLAAVRLKVLAYALGIELSFGMASAATVWGIAVGLVAFTPGGIGLVEGGLAASLVLMGVPPSQAFALTVLERTISYLLASALGAVCFFTLGGKQFLAKTESSMSG